jgi:hypothetical protein
MRTQAVGAPIEVSQVLEELQVVTGYTVEEQLVGQRAAAEVQCEPGIRHGVTQRPFGVNRIAPNGIERLHAKEPRVAPMVVSSPQHPVLVISTEAHDFGRAVALEREDRVDALLGIGPSVDVIAQEHEDVAVTDHVLQLPEQVVEGADVSVNVTDCDRSHTDRVGRATAQSPLASSCVRRAAEISLHPPAF